MWHLCVEVAARPRVSVTLELLKSDLLHLFSSSGEDVKKKLSPQPNVQPSDVKFKMYILTG